VARPRKPTAPQPAGATFQNKANWDNSNNLSVLKPGSVA
jgi:hypothetical protein